MSQGIPAATAEIEKKFDELSDVTNQVALINNIYESDFDKAITKMEAFIAELRKWNLEAISIEHRRYYLSHMSFHREVVAEIISEARSLLIEDRRYYLKKLVSYHREFCQWLSNMEKQYR